MKKKEMDIFIEKKRQREMRNETKLADLKAIIEELEGKLESNQIEITNLSNVMVRKHFSYHKPIFFGIDTKNSTRRRNSKVEKRYHRYKGISS